MADAILQRDLDKSIKLVEVSAGLDAWWRDNHDGCPFPTVPYTTTKTITVCDVWRVFAGPKEWVQDVPGTPFGHWVYPNAQTVCLSHEKEVAVTECLPLLHVSPAGTK